jgi:Ku protein
MKLSSHVLMFRHIVGCPAPMLHLALSSLAQNQIGRIRMVFPSGPPPPPRFRLCLFSLRAILCKLALCATCPIALFPAISESEKISFNQINKKTGHRIRYLKVDADTAKRVPNEDIIKGYQVDKDRYLEVTKDELENIALESTRTIEIDEFVPRTEIDDLYLVRPYYIVPDGKAGHDAYAVIRETIRSLDQVAIGRVVLTNREHVIALSPRQTAHGHAAALSLRSTGRGGIF